MGKKRGWRQKWKRSHMQKLSPVPKELDCRAWRSCGGSSGLRDREAGRVRWSGRKCLSPVRKAMWEAFKWLAVLHSWVAGQDTGRTARRMSNTKNDALLFCPSFLFFFPLVCGSVLVYSWALTLFLFSIFLHVAVSLSCCLLHESSPKYSILYLSLFSLCLCLSFCFPLPLCNSWHSILPAN